MTTILNYTTKNLILRPLNDDVISKIRQFLPPMIRCAECDDYLEAEKLYKRLNLTLGASKGIYPHIKGINMNYADGLLKTCSCCNKIKLCKAHYDRAKFFQKHYRYNENGSMCSKCCWAEIG